MLTRFNPNSLGCLAVRLYVCRGISLNKNKMNAQLLFLLLLASTGSVYSQFLEVSQGQGYADAVYVDLATQQQTTVPHTAWDIAFQAAGRGAGIFVNEGVAGSFSAPSPQVKLFASASTDFATADTTDITAQVFNPEQDWEIGAFNQSAIESNPFDLGWGIYSPNDQSVQGNRVFFIQLRSGNWRKVFINALARGTYTFTHANLDGSDEKSITVNKADFAGKMLAYYSFDDTNAQDLEPANWDLLFTRYTTPLADDNDTLEYTVTGVLHALGVTVAQLDGVDPATETAPSDGFSALPTSIGHDWKTFDFSSSSFLLPEDRLYFLRNADSLYRLQFIDFEGISTGTSVLSITAESAVSNTAEVVTLPASLSPNPISSGQPVQLHLDPEALTHFVNQQQSILRIHDALGRTVNEVSLNLSAGQSPLNVTTTNLPSGWYLITLKAGSVQVVERLLIR